MYQFIKDFYRFMENGHRQGETVQMYVFKPEVTNKSYIDPADGQKKPNPMFGVLFKAQRYEYVYGVSYSEEMKKINPDWVPDEKAVSKYTPSDICPLLKKSVANGTEQLAVVNPQAKESMFYVMNEIGELIPFDEVKYGSVETYRKPRPSSSAPGIRYQNFGIDIIIGLESDGHLFTNEGFPYDSAINPEEVIKELQK